MRASQDQIRYGHVALARTFSGLMDLYEHNYIRLRRLAPDLESANEMISLAPGHLDLFLTVQERCRFTTMINMTYRLNRSGRAHFEPDMNIRIYHDARIAEVHDRLSHHHRIQAGNNLERKWMLNRFLYKWLGYCEFQGHSFRPISEQSERLLKPAIASPKQAV